MYTEFYGLREKPFENTPDPRFLYLSRSHKHALAHLLYAVKEKKGLAVLTGEVGLGKTTLLKSLLSRLDQETRTAFLFNPKLNVEDFLQAICDELGIMVEKESKGVYLAKLYTYLIECFSRKEIVVLIIDEAHMLGPDLLDEVRLLTNLETAREKLLQVILVGQTELDEILEEHRFRPLNQRINVRYRINPLSFSETREYILGRMNKVGYRGRSIFSLNALKAIFRHTRGIPRLINIICDNALLNGFVNDQKIIDRKIIREVVRDLKPPQTWFRWALKWVLIPLLIILLLGAVAFWGREIFPRVREWIGM